jgi:large subunit ribosomal protein L15
MKLHEMKPTPGSRHSKKRIGRGDKTAGRGENGQKSRAGYSKKIGFEGGQNPLYKRLPKRGFKNFTHKEFKPVNLGTLSKLGVQEITLDVLVEKNVIKRSDKLVKILGNGEIDTRVIVHAHAFSKSAQAAIEKAGGEIVIISK